MKRIQSLSTILALAVIMTASAAQAQTRTWGFSKDSVFEWASGRDTVTFTNSGTDTLKFDSIAFELVKPLDTRYEALFSYTGTGAGGVTVVLGYENGQTRYFSPSTGPKNWQIAPGQTGSWRNFTGNHTVRVVAKRAAIVQNDTVHTRLILIAAGGRGRDTVVFLSKQDGPTAIWNGIRAPRADAREGKLFDLRGRRAEKVPEGARVPSRPLVKSSKK
jgi:hypothetical protein